MVLLAILALLAAPAGSTTEDDLFLFTSSVPPNVLVLLDNSGSMDNIVWHPAYDPTVGSDCNAFTDTTTYFLGATGDFTFCGRTRRLYHDPSSNGSTRLWGHYLNWYFSSSNTYQSEIDDPNNGTRACPTAVPLTYAKYQRNRMRAAKQVVLDTFCKVDSTKNVRFGLAIFREASDPNGGFVRVEIEDASPAHDTALENAVTSTIAETWTPLGEALFQTYTYFMSRDSGDLPEGVGGIDFPLYHYSTSTAGEGGGYISNINSVIDSPIQYSCQKNFVVVITDGEPTRDDFDLSPAATALGFASYDNLIGDYHPDGEVEVPGSAAEAAFYLDDIAKYMHENDFRPDLDEDQVIDVYTIGFTTSGPANALLSKAADNANGLFFTSNNAEELTEAISNAITDIIEKSQSFTAATVPSTRTEDGGDFFTSFFLPSSKTAFWEGHLRSFDIDKAGDIFDKNGNCAFVDPDPGECNSGPAEPTAEPFWDAGEEVPLPGSRKLYVSKLNGANGERRDFTVSEITRADLGLQTFLVANDPAPNPIYPGSNAVTAEGLADEITSYARGCKFSTGAASPGVGTTVACDPRNWRLGDIFHSAPAIVTRPLAAIPESSYASFRTLYETRDRVIYAGANDGFLHAFDAGDFDSSTVPARYSKGTGTELFGFMPWEVRQNVRNFPIDSPSDRSYYVDGSPQVADAWIHPTPTSTTKVVSQWRTMLVGGLRQGGRSYYALDVTDPTTAGYPAYQWEWPPETDPDDSSVPTSHLWYLGESWSKPIITRVRVKVGIDDNGGAGYERWVAIVTGGFHVKGDPNDPANYDPAAPEGRAIVILDLKSGEPLAVKRFSAAAPPTDAQSKMAYAIPSTPAVFDLDNNGFADVIYVGDLGGQVFKWVIKPVGEDRVNDGSVADYSQPNWPFKLFFEAPVTDVGGVDYYKSIYYPPSATFYSNTLYLAFGTGERSNLSFDGFSGEDENNRFYVTTDLDPHERLVTPYSTLDEGDLAEVTGDSSCSDVSGYRGYFFKVEDGEKFVTNSEIFASYVFAGSFIPSNTGDPCTSKGSAALYAFRVNCGEAMFTDDSGDLERRVELDDGMPTDPQISVGVDGKDNRIYIEKSGAELESIGGPDIELNNGALLYWREVQ